MDLNFSYYDDEDIDRIAQLKLLEDELALMQGERDEARLRLGSILNEIDCRIEHGAESNGHLEGVRNLFKENSDER